MTADVIGRLDRRITILRAGVVDDGYAERPGVYAAVAAIWATKTDVSDAERFRSGAISAEITTRFVVRWSEFAAGIGPKDRIRCEGRDYDIVGVKETERRRWLEITGRARTDT